MGSISGLSLGGPTKVLVSLFYSLKVPLKLKIISLTLEIFKKQEDFKHVNIQQEAKLLNILYGGALPVSALLKGERYGSVDGDGALVFMHF